MSKSSQIDSNHPANFLNKPLIIALFATICCFLWGSAFPSLKVSYALLDIASSPWPVKMQFAGYRFFLSAILIFGFMLLFRIPIKIKKSEFAPLLTLGIFQTTIQYIFFYVGISNTTGIIGSILTATGTFFSLVLPHFYYKDDKMTRNKMLGLIIGFSGVFVMNFGKGGIDGHFTFWGEGLLILSSLVSASASIYAKETTRSIDPFKCNAYQMLFGSSLMIIASFFFTKGNAIHFNMSSFPIFLWLSFISGAAYTIWYLLLKNNKVSTVSIYKFQVPLWGSMLSALFVAGESITTMTFLALIMTVTGIVLVHINEKRPRQSNSPQ